MTKEEVFALADASCFHTPVQEAELLRFAALVAKAERYKIAAWMIDRSYATGHGDTTEDLLKELEWQIKERERERQESHRLQQQAWNIDSKYASLLALTLECMILDPRRWHDDAVKVLDDYRSEWNRLNPSPSPFGKD